MQASLVFYMLRMLLHMLNLPILSSYMPSMFPQPTSMHGLWDIHAEHVTSHAEPAHTVKLHAQHVTPTSLPKTRCYMFMGMLLHICGRCIYLIPVISHANLFQFFTACHLTCLSGRYKCPTCHITPRSNSALMAYFLHPMPLVWSFIIILPFYVIS